MGCADRMGRDGGRRLRAAFDLVVARWNASGRHAGGEDPAAVHLSHFLLAATGLVIWIIYLADDKDALAWIAFAILAVVALLGWTMFAIWYRRRQRGAVEGAAVAGGDGPAEQHFPVSVVALHGALAVTTVVLVFLTAIGVGGS